MQSKESAILYSILRRELLSNLLTFRLALALVFTVVLSALTTLIGSLDFSRNFEAYQREYKALGEQLDQSTVYGQLEPRLVLPPQPLSILCRGNVGTAGQNVWMSLGYIPISSWLLAENSDSNLMQVMGQIDFVTVVSLLLSFLALVLGFDGICGERESGILKQVLANPIPRTHIVMGKLAGGTISLLLPLSVAFAFSLLIMLATPHLVFSADDWLRLGILFLLSCLFLCQIFALSLMVSTLVRQTSISLLVCLFAWLVGGIGYTNVLPSFSRYGVDNPPAAEWRQQNRQAWNEYEKTVEQWQQKHPAPGPAYLKGLERNNRLRYAHPLGYEWLQRKNAFATEKNLERGEARYKFQWANWESLAREAYLVDQWSILSPFTNYQVLGYQLARTTLDDRFFAAAAGRRYRRAFIGYLRSKDAFASRRWFSDDPPGHQPMISDPEKVTAQMLAADSPFMRDRMAWAEEQEKQIGAGRRLDLSDMPKHSREWQRSLDASFAVMLPGLAVLILSTGLAVLATIVLFQRYDPR